MLHALLRSAGARFRSFFCIAFLLYFFEFRLDDLLYIATNAS